MYEKCDGKYARIGIAYWCIYMVGLFFMGIMYEKGLPYQSIYLTFFALLILIAFLINRKEAFQLLGFGGKKLKTDCIISICIVAVVFLISIFGGKDTVLGLLKTSLYFLFYIGAVEEIIFRGFIQNCLFGLKAGRTAIFIIGAVFFSLMHLPFQMYVHHNVSLTYIVQAFPQLIYTFLFHLFMCFLTYKRGNILIPIALHYTLNYMEENLFINILFGACYIALIIGYIKHLCSVKKEAKGEKQQ